MSLATMRELGQTDTSVSVDENTTFVAPLSRGVMSLPSAASVGQKEACSRKETLPRSIVSISVMVCLTHPMSSSLKLSPAQFTSPSSLAT